MSIQPAFPTSLLKSAKDKDGGQLSGDWSVSEAGLSLRRPAMEGTIGELEESEVSRSIPDYVRWVQGALNMIMGLRLSVDGIAGPLTRSAIRGFQQKNGLVVDGIVGPQTEAALVKAGAQPYPTNSYLRGAPSSGQVNRSSPDYIYWVQGALNKIMGSQLVLDGIVGPLTRSVTRSFQQKYGLLVDGIVGPQTEAALIRVGAVPFTPPTDPNLRIKQAHWENWVGDYHYFGTVAKPLNQSQLVTVIEKAVRERKRIRAVGSGHSNSCCARPREMFVDISAIDGPFERVDWLKSNPPGLAQEERLVRVRAGTTLKELNRLHLHQMNPPLGLINAGTFDGQTVAGAISTGTHGTGMRLGNLADMVVSMDIATVTKKADGSPEVQMRRIEPSDGVTDRAAFDRDFATHGMVLEQNDDLFYAMVVSLGCMGIVYAYTLKVCTEYWLEEETKCIPWPQLAAQLSATTKIPGVGDVPALADSARHVWFMLNIAEMQGKNKTAWPACFLITRVLANAIAKPEHWHKAWPPERKSDFWKEAAQDWVGLDPRKPHDGVGKRIRSNFLKTEVGKPAFQGDHYSSVSYIVHRREQEDRKPQEPPEPPPFAISTEIAVPATAIVPVVNTAIDCVKRSQRFFVTPWGVRFSSASNHYLSPAYGRASAWLEVGFALPSPLVHAEKKMQEVRDAIAKPELEKIEAALCNPTPLAGRPHPGKHNTLNRAKLTQLFPKFDVWLTAYKRFNAFGTFDNDYTDQLGLTGVR